MKRLKITFFNFGHPLIWLTIFILKITCPELGIFEHVNIWFIGGVGAIIMIFSFTDNPRICYGLSWNEEYLNIFYYDLTGREKSVRYSLRNIVMPEVSNNQFLGGNGTMRLTGTNVYISYRLYNKETFGLAEEMREYWKKLNGK